MIHVLSEDFGNDSYKGGGSEAAGFTLTVPSTKDRKCGFLTRSLQRRPGKGTRGYIGYEEVDGGKKLHRYCLKASKGDEM